MIAKLTHFDCLNKGKLSSAKVQLSTIQQIYKLLGLPFGRIVGSAIVGHSMRQYRLFGGAYFLRRNHAAAAAFIRALPGECATVVLVWNGNMAVGSVVCRSNVHFVIDFNRVFNFTSLLGSGKLIEVCTCPIFPLVICVMTVKGFFSVVVY